MHTTINIEFSKQSTILARLIRWFTWSRWSHVSVPIRDGLTIESREFKGVIRTSNRYDNSDLLTLEVEKEEADQFYHLLDSQVGKSYDYLGVLGFIFRSSWARDNRWFCSELVAWALVESGIINLSKNHSRITPGDLYHYLTAAGFKVN